MKSRNEWPRIENYVASLVALIGHMICTGAVFLVLISVGWVVNVCLVMVDEVRPFPSEVLKVVTRLELYLVYLDTAVCLVLLTSGMIAFCRGVLEQQR